MNQKNRNEHLDVDEFKIQNQNVIIRDENSNKQKKKKLKHTSSWGEEEEVFFQQKPDNKFLNKAKNDAEFIKQRMAELN